MLLSNGTFKRNISSSVIVRRGSSTSNHGYGSSVLSVFIVWLLGVCETAIFVSACKAGSSLASFVGF